MSDFCVRFVAFEQDHRSVIEDAGLYLDKLRCEHRKLHFEVENANFDCEEAVDALEDSSLWQLDQCFMQGRDAPHDLRIIIIVEQQGWRKAREQCVKVIEKLQWTKVNHPLEKAEKELEEEPRQNPEGKLQPPKKGTARLPKNPPSVPQPKQA